jgi:hypothetical protein
VDTESWSPAIIAWKDVFGGVLPRLALDFIGTGTRETNPEMLIDPNGVDKGKMKEMPCKQ